jgi:poly(A) polymerase
MEEFKRADAIVNSVHTGKKVWNDLFEWHSFFTQDHKYYLSIIAAGRTLESFESFAGLVHSKARLLQKGIEDGDTEVEVARLYCEETKRVHRCETEEQVDRICQGDMSFQISKDAVENGASNGESKEQHTIYTATCYIGLTLREGKYYRP